MRVGQDARRAAVVAMGMREHDSAESIQVQTYRLDEVPDLGVRPAALHEQSSTFALNEVAIAVTAGRERPHLHGRLPESYPVERLSGSPRMD